MPGPSGALQRCPKPEDLSSRIGLGRCRRESPQPAHRLRAGRSWPGAGWSARVGQNRRSYAACERASSTVVKQRRSLVSWKPLMALGNSGEPTTFTEMPSSPATLKVSTRNCATRAGCCRGMLVASMTAHFEARLAQLLHHGLHIGRQLGEIALQLVLFAKERGELDEVFLGHEEGLVLGPRTARSRHQWNPG